MKKYIPFLWVLACIPAYASDKACYAQCLRDGDYSGICEGICTAPEGAKEPGKTAMTQYECYKECIGKGKGAIGCAYQCKTEMAYPPDYPMAPTVVIEN